jgi:hypothetical protein
MSTTVAILTSAPAQTKQNHYFVDAQTRTRCRGTKVRWQQPDYLCTMCERNKIKILLRSPEKYDIIYVNTEHWMHTE